VGTSTSGSALVRDPAPVDVIPDVAVVYRQERNRLRGVHDAAASESDDHVAAFPLCEFGALRGYAGQRVAFDFVEHDRRDSGAFQQADGLFKKAGFFRAVPSGDDQRLFAVFRSPGTELQDLPRSENKIDGKAILKFHGDSPFLSFEFSVRCLLKPTDDGSGKRFLRRRFCILPRRPFLNPHLKIV
jgi:hypothetical protein